MFEGSIPAADSAESPISDGLRLISWPELVARFDAAHELRGNKFRAANVKASVKAGSFSALSQAPSAADPVTINKTDPRINPTSLGHSKADTAKELERVDNAPTPSREHP